MKHLRHMLDEYNISARIVARVGEITAGKAASGIPLSKRHAALANADGKPLAKRRVLKSGSTPDRSGLPRIH